LAKKVQLGLIGSRPRAFHRAIDEPCTCDVTSTCGIYMKRLCQKHHKMFRHFISLVKNLSTGNLKCNHCHGDRKVSA